MVALSDQTRRQSCVGIFESDDQGARRIAERTSTFHTSGLIDRPFVYRSFTRYIVSDRKGCYRSWSGTGNNLTGLSFAKLADCHSQYPARWGAQDCSADIGKEVQRQNMVRPSKSPEAYPTTIEPDVRQE